MTDRWETHKGDDYWYSCYWCDAEASYNPAPGIFTIEKILPKGHRVTNAQLLDLLSKSIQQFEDVKIKLKTDTNTLAIIESLEMDGKIEVNFRTSLGVKYAYLSLS